MFTTILITLAAAFGLLVLTGLYGQLHRHAQAKAENLEAQSNLLREQAAHVAQNVASEATQQEALIKSYEKQGANKLRSEIARLGGDLRKVEEQLGSKLKGLTPEEHETELAKSRKIILDLQDQVDKLTPPALIGQLGGSGTAANAVSAVPIGETTALGSV